MSFFAELRRRSVFRVAGVYVVTAWLVMQVVAVSMPALDLPEWFDGGVLLLLAIGFPVALVLAWAFELTPEGVKRTSSAEPGAHMSSFGGVDALLAAAILALVVITGFQLARPPAAPAPDDDVEAVVARDDRPSIAVLPFSDLSPAGDQEYFSNGIAEEILNVLAGVDGLNVTSRTSSFAYQSQEEIGVPLIAQRLGVRFVLEGSVRKAGETFRITTQLIDAEADTHVWSETFDRTLSMESLFDVQDDIANSVVRAVLAPMGLEGAQAPVIDRQAETQSLDAYELYLEANARFIARGQDNVRESARLLERVSQLDPDFARGWAALSVVASVAPNWGIDDQDYHAIAIAAAEKAIALNPELAAPYAGLGGVAWHRRQPDLENAMRNFDRAIELDPEDATSRLWRAQVLVFLGYFEEADADLEACLEIEPGYGNCMHFLAMSSAFQGDEDRARMWFDRLLAAGFSDYFFGAFVDLFRDDDQETSLLWLLQWFADWHLDAHEAPWVIEPLYRAVTDPGFPRQDELRVFEAQLRARDLTSAMNERWFRNDYFYLFGAYDRIEPTNISYYHWNRRLAAPEHAALRRRWIEQHGLPAYWRAHGFPPQCRPLGGDDFECF